MRIFAYFAVAFCLMLSISACSNDGKLTNSRAEAALRRWMPESNARVTGIQEIPQQNVATANIMFANFSFSRHEDFRGLVPKTYSGPGVASFTHYNDGRWILTKVVTSQGPLSTYWDNLSIEVP